VIEEERKEERRKGGKRKVAEWQSYRVAE